MAESPADRSRVDLAWADTRRTSRLHVRVSPEFKGRLEQAAQTQGTSISDFVTDAVRARVDEVLGARWVVPDEYFDELLRALDEPVRPLEWLADTSAKREEILRRADLHDVIG